MRPPARSESSHITAEAMAKADRREVRCMCRIAAARRHWPRCCPKDVDFTIQSPTVANQNVAGRYAFARSAQSPRARAKSMPDALLASRNRGSTSIS